MTTASDNFNRADGAMGANWSTCSVNSWVISSNKAKPNTSAAFNMMRYTGASFAADQECQVIPQPSGGSYPGPAVRVDASGNGYAAMVDSGSNGWRLARIDAGGNNDLATGTETFNGTSDTLKVRASGSTITLWRNGVQLASATDATYTSGAPGLWSYEANGTVDDWTATDSLGSGGSAALTGSALTSAQGTLVPAKDKALTGQALASAQGTATPVRSVPLTGTALAASSGTVTPNVQIGLTGQGLTFGQGTLSASAGGDVTVSITGQALTASAGNLAAALSKAVSGNSASASAGTLAPANNLALTGTGISSAQGTLTFVGDVTVALTGISMTLGQGTLSPPAAAADTGAGRSRRRRHYLLEIDGQYFEVADAQHAQAILDRAREVAKGHAEELTRKELPKSRRIGRRPIAVPTPKIDSPDPELREVIQSARKAINAVYKNTALDTELAALLARALADEDEEEAILLLL